MATGWLVVVVMGSVGSDTSVVSGDGSGIVDVVSVVSCGGSWVVVVVGAEVVATTTGTD